MILTENVCDALVAGISTGVAGTENSLADAVTGSALTLTDTAEFAPPLRRIVIKATPAFSPTVNVTWLNSTVATGLVWPCTPTQKTMLPVNSTIPVLNHEANRVIAAY